MGAVYWDLPNLGPFQPFVGGGLGVSRNRVSKVRYVFPSLGPTAATITPSGSKSDLAMMLTAGTSLPLSERLSVEMAYRFADLGHFQTSAADATIIRTARSLSIAIDGTKGRLRTHGAILSLRHTF